MKQVEAAVDALNLFLQNTTKFCHTAQQMGRRITVLHGSNRNKQETGLQTPMKDNLTTCQLASDKLSLEGCPQHW